MILNKMGFRTRETTYAPLPESKSGLKNTHPATSPIYLISMASIPNYGDELITLRWLQYLAQTHPTTDIWLDVREPGLATSLFKDAHPRLHITNTLFRAIHEYLHGDERTPADKITNLSSPKYDLGLLDLRNAGTLHLLGGGFINSFWPHHRLIIDAMKATQAVSGARLLATGQGLMPYNGETFEGFDHVSVRDTPSAEALGIEPGLDDAFLLPPDQSPASSRIQNQEPSLYLCVQNDALAPGAHEAMIDFTRQQIQTLTIPRERTFYVEAIPGDDYAGYNALRDLVAEDGFIPFAHFWKNGFKYHPNQIWITSRFHHHLNAALHGARGIALVGNPGYYDIKHGSLKDLGTQWEIINPLAHQPSPFTLEQLTYPNPMDPYVTQKTKEAKHLYP